MAKIKVSRKWLEKRFNCTKEYILAECHGRCCYSKERLFITLTPDEEQYFTSILPKNLIDAANLNKVRKCFFQDDQNLCKLHDTDKKSFGCVASPFAFNKKHTLIIRRRAISFPCFGKGEPAYITFRHSLEKLFGKEQSNYIVGKMTDGSTDSIYVEIDKSIIDMFRRKDRTIYFNIVNT